MSERYGLGGRSRGVVDLEFGAQVLPGQGVRFRVWAPRARTLDVTVVSPSSRVVGLERGDGDVFEAIVPGIAPGADYFYLIDGDRERPDPVSRWQPHGVHGPSRVVDPAAHAWTDPAWKGIPLEGYILYELHVGTFTVEGTFEAVIPTLADLRQLGVTAVEIMPVAEFPGERNWGYDGVHLYAPQSSYGGPSGLRRLIDACHHEGLAVVLDVVYNHLGPEGNYLSEYAPYFSGRYRTPWGEAVNFDGADSDGVRRFFVDNALYWVTEYHVDALRLDAVHSMFDFSAQHILEEIAAAVHERAAWLGRSVWVIAESDLNDPRVISPVEVGGFGIDAQWSDDFHHSLHVLLTGNKRGYLADFGRMDDLRKALTQGFVYDGNRSTYRRRRHGGSSAARPGWQFVICTQNHDQVANGAWGDRLSVLTSSDSQKLAAAVLVCAPNLPMLFMGQEYGELAPFLYFTSHGEPALVEAVRSGRREEFSAFAWEREFPDPHAESTFIRSKLDWRLREVPLHAALRDFYRDLLALRRERLSLRNCRMDLTTVHANEMERWLVLTRADANGEATLCLFNFHADPQRLAVPASSHRWQLVLHSGDSRYGGNGDRPTPPATIEGAGATVPVFGFGAAIYAGH